MAAPPDRAPRDLHLVAVDHDRVVAYRDFPRKAPVRRVVLEQVAEGRESVMSLTATTSIWPRPRCGAKQVAPDATETIDADPDCHSDPSLTISSLDRDPVKLNRTQSSAALAGDGGRNGEQRGSRAFGARRTLRILAFFDTHLRG